MLYAKIYQRQILKDSANAAFVGSFDGKQVILSKSRIEVYDLDSTFHFASELRFAEEDPFSETTTYTGEFSESSKFRLLRPGSLSLIQLKGEYNCKDAFTIASVDPQGYALRFILSEDLGQPIEILEKSKADQVF